MRTTEFRVESDHPVSDRGQYSTGDRPLTVARAEESDTKPSGREIRVIHVPTGKVIFRKSTPVGPKPDDEF